MHPRSVALCAALAALPVGCGGDADPAPARNEAVPARTGTFSWMPSHEGPHPPYLEEVHENLGEWIRAWDRRRDAREPAPTVDFAAERVVVVAQHARHGGYGGARLLRVRRSAGTALVEYAAPEPEPGTFHPQVYKGYLGFWATVPREAGPARFRRTAR